MAPNEPLVEIRGLIKDFRGLRPLRIQTLDLHAGRSTVLLNVDAAAAEVLVNLIMGATVPDAGSVKVFGRSTDQIPDADAWLASMDQFGLVSERAVLIDQLSVAQNLALPLSLDLDDLPSHVRERVASLAEEVGLSAFDLSRPAGDASPATRMRLRLGRALALGPKVLLAEHPNAPLSADEGQRLAADLAHIVTKRGLSLLVMTASQPFAHAVGGDVWTLAAATGELRSVTGWRRWFS